MTELKDILAAYTAAWGETKPDARDVYLEACWADEAIYQDPTAQVVGRAALSKHIEGLHAQFPGAKIEMTSGTDTHHSSLRFGWHLRLGDGSVAVEGIDFATLAPDGRLASVTGFFGPLPPAS